MRLSILLALSAVAAVAIAGTETGSDSGLNAQVDSSTTEGSGETLIQQANSANSEELVNPADQEPLAEQANSADSGLETTVIGEGNPEDVVYGGSNPEDVKAPVTSETQKLLTEQVNSEATVNGGSNPQDVVEGGSDFEEVVDGVIKPENVKPPVTPAAEGSGEGVIQEANIVNTDTEETVNGEESGKPRAEEVKVDDNVVSDPAAQGNGEISRPTAEAWRAVLNKLFPEARVGNDVSEETVLSVIALLKEGSDIPENGSVKAGTPPPAANIVTPPTPNSTKTSNPARLVTKKESLVEAKDSGAEHVIPTISLFIATATVMAQF